MPYQILPDELPFSYEVSQTSFQFDGIYTSDIDVSLDSSRFNMIAVFVPVFSINIEKYDEKSDQANRQHYAFTTEIQCRSDDNVPVQVSSDIDFTNDPIGTVKTTVRSSIFYATSSTEKINIQASCSPSRFYTIGLRIQNNATVTIPCNIIQFHVLGGSAT